MARSETLEAIILKSYDVGEADRYCILLTKERGRIAARARGVRKLKSRMGGTLLPCTHLSVTLSESSAGLYITGVSIQSDFAAEKTIAEFARTQQATELLLALLHDEEALPDVFELLLTYLQTHNGSVLSFTLKLLHILGVLPGEGTDAFTSLHTHDQQFMRANIRGDWPEHTPQDSLLPALCTRSIQEQTSTTLRSPTIVPLLSV